MLPSELVMSIGMGFVFVPLASTALIGVGNHDAGAEDVGGAVHVRVSSR